MSPGCDIVAAPFSCLPCRFAPPLGSPISSSHAAFLACRCPSRLSSRLSSRRHLIGISSSRLVHRPVILFPRSAACLPRLIISSVTSNNLLACRPFVPLLVPSPISPVRSVLPWMMSLPPCPIAPPCRSACGHRSPRSTCRMAGSGTGRVAALVIACPPCRRCLSWDGVSSACVSSLRAALLAWVPPFVSVL